MYYINYILSLKLNIILLENQLNYKIYPTSKI
jgi:hypothetical protein